MAATLVWAGVMALVAFVRVVPVVFALMFVGGMAWISLVATFNASAQTAVPAWVPKSGTAAKYFCSV